MLKVNLFNLLLPNSLTDSRSTPWPICLILPRAFLLQEMPKSFLSSPISLFPAFLVSCHRLLQRAISVGSLGGRQGCHCQHQLSPTDANAAEKSAPHSGCGIKLVLLFKGHPALPWLSPSYYLPKFYQIAKGKGICYYSRMFISYTID